MSLAWVSLSTSPPRRRADPDAAPPPCAFSVQEQDHISYAAAADHAEESDWSSGPGVVPLPCRPLLDRATRPSCELLVGAASASAARPFALLRAWSWRHPDAAHRSRDRPLVQRYRASGRTVVLRLSSRTSTRHACPGGLLEPVVRSCAGETCSDVNARMACTLRAHVRGIVERQVTNGRSLGLGDVAVPVAVLLQHLRGRLGVGQGQDSFVVDVQPVRILIVVGSGCPQHPR